MVCHWNVWLPRNFMGVIDIYTELFVLLKQQKYVDWCYATCVHLLSYNFNRAKHNVNT